MALPSTTFYSMLRCSKKTFECVNYFLTVVGFGVIILTVVAPLFDMIMHLLYLYNLDV